MPRLPETGRLTADSVPRQFRDWVSRALVEPINRIVEPLYQALDRNANLSANLNAQILTKTVTVPDEWITATLASGATTPDSARPAKYRFTPDGDIDAIGVVSLSAVPGTLYYLPAGRGPSQLLTFPQTANSLFASVTVGAAGSDGRHEVRQTVGATGGTNVQFRLRPTNPSPIPAACWGASCEFQSQLRSPCVGVQLLGALELDSAGKPAGVFVPGVVAPDWEELLATDRRGRAIRIRNQLGLKPMARYRLTWLAWGD